MSWKALRASLVSNTRRMNHRRGSDSWQVERQPWRGSEKAAKGQHRPQISPAHLPRRACPGAPARPASRNPPKELADLPPHVPAGHVGEDGLQHDLDGGGLLAERGEDGEEPVAHRYGVQAPVEVLVLGQVEPAGP